jgi:DtxR family transcriptional regulator, Mn-dependent transcriptional regulator
LSRSESSEMYLETIYILESAHGHAHIADIAARLGVKKSSVTKAVEQLKEEDLVCHDSYGPVTLTAKGRSISKQIYRKHNLITRYLMKSLHLDPEEAAENACMMEHIVTEGMLKAIEKYLAKEN